ncbi:MAG: 5'-methylthioadenosine/S-adenosylhomocysteine nucleosidase [Prevotella sp.]|nr:5'-methylthioadenosine/S-adenosylhomocysteine nucleosidase [Prevotella sp.]
MKIGIIVAMEKEMRQLQQLFTDNPQVRIVKSGIGKVNAALGAQRLISEFHPQVIVSTGCAGGHGDGVCVQDVVVSTELSYHDVYCGDAAGSTVYGQVQGLPARFQADPVLLRKASLIGTGNISLHPGLIVTGDWFVDSKEKMREIVGHFPECRAVDMESAAIAQTCLLNKVRFISFRVISDLPLEDSDASMYHDFWSTLADRSFQVTKTFIESL